MKKSFLISIVFAILSFSSLASYAQEIERSRNYVVPQAASFRSYRPNPDKPVEIKAVKVDVQILEQVATTVMEINLHNPNQRWVEAELLVPVPDGSIFKGFTFEGGAKEPTFKIMPKAEAKMIYSSIVAKLKDPALLEFVGYNLIKTSVFPIDAMKTQKVHIEYENLLQADGDRIDYVIPRTESLEYKIPWDISVQIKSKRNISTAYSPSHLIDLTRVNQNCIQLKLNATAKTEVGSFLLSYLLEKTSISASLMAYPDPKIDGGYFLLLAGLPAKIEVAKINKIKREVFLVIDRSGSMSGEKIEQAKEAAKQVIGGLKDGEAFNMLTYNSSVNLYSKTPIIKTKETQDAAFAFINTITAMGGTNIYDALGETLVQKPSTDFLPIVLFLTDGQPTSGNTSEKDICSLAVKANTHNRRIFSFGVGYDVNSPLLEKIANDSRAIATFVQPKENVEVKIGSVFKRLQGPVFADTSIDVLTEGSDSKLTRVFDMMPAKLPDLFRDDQLVILGKYVGDKPMTFKLSGNLLGEKKEFKFTFKLEKATVKNSFIPRLWANKKIGLLIDAIREMGADGSNFNPRTPNNKINPKLAELGQEILRLSVEFGILTEYTAFLAEEGTDLAKKEKVQSHMTGNLVERGMKTRAGRGAVNQGINSQRQRASNNLNRGNAFVDENMNRVEIKNVQQVNDRTFFKRGKNWVDSRVLDKYKELKPDFVIEFASEEYEALLTLLVKSNRQGLLALKGDIIVVIAGKIYLIKAPVEPKDSKDEKSKEKAAPKDNKLPENKPNSQPTNK